MLSSLLAVPTSAALRLSARRMATQATTVTAALQPFHLAIPVNNLDTARTFYGTLLGCEEGRSSKTWIDFNFFGHQLVTHWVGNEYRGPKHFNAVDKDAVPVPHFGICLPVDAFHALAAKMEAANTKFILEPKLRFEGAPGEQYTMFFEDPSGNSLEFKALTKPENLFARYYVQETGHGKA